MKSADKPTASLFGRLSQYKHLPVVLWISSILAFTSMCTALLLTGKDGIPVYSDYTSFHAAGLAWDKGMSVYSPFVYSPLIKNMLIPEDAPVFLNPNLNAPVFTFLIYPFTKLGTDYSYYAWCAVQFLLGFALFLAIAKRTLPSSPLLIPGSLLIFSAWFPIFTNLLIGQVGLFLFAFLAAGWLALDKNKPDITGLFFGLALLLKPFIGLLFIWLLLKKQWRVLFAGSAVWLAGMGIAILILGLGDHIGWFGRFSEVDIAGQSWNAAIESITARYFGGGHWEGVVDWPWARWAIRSTSWILATWAFIWLSRQTNSLHTGIALSFPLMLLLSPLGWIYYFPILLISAAILLREGANPHYLALTMILAGIPQLLAKGDELTPKLWHFHPYGGHWALVDGKPVYAYEGGWHWFVLPEIYTLALILLCAIALKRGHSRNLQPAKEAV